MKLIKMIKYITQIGSILTILATAITILVNNTLSNKWKYIIIFLLFAAIILQLVQAIENRHKSYEILKGDNSKIRKEFSSFMKDLLDKQSNTVILSRTLSWAREDDACKKSLINLANKNKLTILTPAKDNIEEIFKGNNLEQKANIFYYGNDLSLEHRFTITNWKSRSGSPEIYIGKKIDDSNKKIKKHIIEQITEENNPELCAIILEYCKAIIKLSKNENNPQQNQ